MKTYISFHDITRVTATTPGSLGAPVILQLHDGFERQGDVTIFLGDHHLAMRIASAINDAVEHKCKPDPAHKEAHDCAAEYDRLLLDEAGNIERIEEIERNRKFKR